MERNILIRGARQLLTLHGPSGPRRGDALRNLGVIEDGSVLIVNGAIASVGPTRRVENLAEARSAQEINATGHVVMPGFVDSCSRLLSAPARVLQFRSSGLTRSLRAGNLGTLSTALQYLRTTPAGTLEFQARKYIDFAVRHGTTTMEVRSGTGLNASAETKCLRVLSAIADSCARIVPAFSAAWTEFSEFGDARAWIQWAASELLPKLRERKLIACAGVECDQAALSAEDSRLWLDFATRLGLPVRVEGDRASRMGAAQLAVEFHAASADGLNSIDQTDIDALSRSQTVATLLPGATCAEPQARFAPARELIDRGAAVAIASGFDPSAASTFNMQAVISLACSHLQMTPEEAISAATVNGAHAVRVASRCGSLEFGKDADLLILNVSDYREIPLHFGCAIVALTMRKGHVVYREGALSCGGA